MDEYARWRFGQWYMDAYTFAALRRRGECGPPGERDGREVLGNHPLYWRGGVVRTSRHLAPGVVLGLDVPCCVGGWTTTLYNQSDEVTYSVRAHISVGLTVSRGARIGRGEVEL